MSYDSQNRPRWASWLLCAVLALVGVPNLTAATFSNVYFLGDSLSDTGNAFLLSGGFIPPPPYFQGRFSDGPVFTEVLADNLGYPNADLPSFAGGNNYAFGGALTGLNGVAPLTGILSQTVQLTSKFGGGVDPNALYVVYGGANDLLAAVDIPDTTARAGAISQTAENLQLAVFALASAGARNFLIPNQPDLGTVPRAFADGITGEATAASVSFNLELLARMNQLEAGLGLNIVDLDVFSLFNAIRADALTNGGAVYGITNVSTPCIGTANCGTSLFFDDLHPTSATHAIFGEAATNAVTQAEPIPEPGTVLLLSSGMGVLLLVRRMRRG